jgi:hypothetical protein
MAISGRCLGPYTVKKRSAAQCIRVTRLQMALATSSALRFDAA